MNKEQQKMIDRFEVLVGELHAHTEKIIAIDGLNKDFWTMVCVLNVCLKSGFPEYFQEKK